MTQRAPHRSETICIGCLNEYKPARTHLRARGTSKFCSSCRVSNGEPRWARTVSTTPTSRSTTDVATTLALIDALGFWLDA